MSRLAFISLILFAVSALFVLPDAARGGGSFRRSSSRLDRPPVFLWAWERPTDLNFLDTEKVAVAYLEQTLILSGREVLRKPRRQRLKVPSGCFLEAVNRVEIDQERAPLLDDRQLSKLAAMVVDSAARPGVKSVQIDFDAPVSMRPFYRQLVSRVRNSLPEGTGLTMTALASWVIGDAWLKNMDVDSVVPMFFRMGADRKNVIQFLRASKPFNTSGKHLAIGVSMDESDILDVFSRSGGRTRLRDREIYIFSPGQWEQERLANTIRKFI